MASPGSLRALAARSPLVTLRNAAVLGVSLLVAGTLAVTLLDDESGSSSLRIEEGDSLSRLFARAELPDIDLLAVMEAGHGGARVPPRPRSGRGGADPPPGRTAGSDA